MAFRQCCKICLYKIAQKIQIKLLFSEKKDCGFLSEATVLLFQLITLAFLHISLRCSGQLKHIGTERSVSLFSII